jgi:hypothetical protein
VGTSHPNVLETGGEMTTDEFCVFEQVSSGMFEERTIFPLDFGGRADFPRGVPDAELLGATTSLGEGGIAFEEKVVAGFGRNGAGRFGRDRSKSEPVFSRFHLGLAFLGIELRVDLRQLIRQAKSPWTERNGESVIEPFAEKENP